MADIAQTVLNTSNDLKVRFAADLSNGQDATGQFMDVMLAGRSSTDADLSALHKNSADNAVAAHVAKKLGTKKDDEATTANIKAAATVKIDVKQKIKAKIKNIIARDQTPVKDMRALNALKKVATFILKASNDGQISLPKELTQKLNDFLDKAEANPDGLKAADIVDFMQDFINSFRQMLIPMVKSEQEASVDGTTGVDAKPALAWPKEIADLFKDLKLNGFTPEGEKVTTLDVMRAIKMLVNASQDSATASLDAKANEALTSQDDAAALIPVAAEKESETDDKASNKAEAKSAPVKPAFVPAADFSSSVAADTATEQAASLPQPKFAAENKKSESPLAKPVASNEGLLPQPMVNGAALRNELSSQGSVSTNAKSEPVVSASTLSPALNNLLSNDQAQPNGISQINQNRFNDMVAKATQQLTQNSGSAVEQVLVQIQARAGKASSLSVQLTPAELGRVDIRLETKGNNQTHVVVAADKPETLALLQKDASALQKALQQAGINANAENMSFNLREQRNGQGFTRQKFTRTQIEDAPKELALNVQGDGSIISDSRVNYHA